MLECSIELVAGLLRVFANRVVSMPMSKDE